MKENEHRLQAILFQKAQERHLIYDDWAAAIELYKQHGAICRQNKFMPELMCSIIGQAVCAMRLGRAKDAIALAEEAREVAQSVGNSDAIDSVEKLLASFRSDEAAS